VSASVYAASLNTRRPLDVPCSLIGGNEEVSIFSSLLSLTQYGWSMVILVDADNKDEKKMKNPPVKFLDRKTTVMADKSSNRQISNFPTRQNNSS